MNWDCVSDMVIQDEIKSAADQLCKLITSSMDMSKLKDGICGIVKDLSQTADKTKMKHITQQPKKDVRITPLMIACDKRNMNALKCFIETLQNDDFQNKEKIVFSMTIGSCYQPSPDGGNQAIHYGIEDAQSLHFLAHIHALQCRVLDADPNCHALKDEFIETQYSCLLSQQNDHGDTPLMIAAANDKLVTIKSWIELVQSSSSRNTQQNNDFLRNIVLQKNDSDDSIISILYGHGKQEILRYLLSLNKKGALPIAQIKFDDVKKCKAIISKMNLLEKRVPVEHKEAFDNQKANIEICLEILTDTISQQAEDMTVLLLTEDEPTEQRKTKRKSKNQKKKSAARGTKSNDDSRMEKSHSEPIEVAKPKFVTMDDGTMVSDEKKYIPEQDSQATIKFSTHEKTIHDLLKERCDDTLSQKSEELMEALCLDVKMLLYSPHALAMHLSPSQLEAVETVLKNQLQAVTQAKEIHSRLLQESMTSEK